MLRRVESCSKTFRKAWQAFPRRDPVGQSALNCGNPQTRLVKFGLGIRPFLAHVFIDFERLFVFINTGLAPKFTGTGFLFAPICKVVLALSWASRNVLQVKVKSRTKVRYRMKLDVMSLFFLRI